MLTLHAQTLHSPSLVLSLSLSSKVITSHEHQPWHSCQGRKPRVDGAVLADACGVHFQRLTLRLGLRKSKAALLLSVGMFGRKPGAVAVPQVALRMTLSSGCNPRCSKWLVHCMERTFSEPSSTLMGLFFGHHSSTRPVSRS